MVQIPETVINCDRTTNRYFYPREKQTENKWVTFYSYLCLKYKHERGKNLEPEKD